MVDSQDCNTFMKYYYLTKIPLEWIKLIENIFLFRRNIVTFRYES